MVPTVTLFSTTPQWRARTVALENPGDLLGYLTSEQDIAWIRHDEGVVGLGVAERQSFACVDDAHQWWSEFAAAIEHETEMPGEWGTGPLAFGSFPFDAERSAAQPMLIVPRTIVGIRDGRAWLTTLSPGWMDAHDVPLCGEVPHQSLSVKFTSASIDQVGWQNQVAELVQRLGDPNQSLEALVLARMLRARASEPLRPLALLASLSTNYPNCTTFYVDGLVGATPELLVRFRGGLATSRVLGGSIHRLSPDTDQQRAAALATSAKELAKHRHNVEVVADRFKLISRGVNVPENPYVLRIPHVMHLASEVTAAAGPEESVLTLVDKLHPTAATGGTPTDEAMATIAAMEGFDRGRYTGPIGWVDANGEGEWGIALRCGQLDPNDPHSIDLYAACGITPSSDPNQEWAETQAKLRPMLEALNAVSVPFNVAVARS